VVRDKTVLNSTIFSGLINVRNFYQLPIIFKINRRGDIVVKKKVVTICGSVRFWSKIQEMSERLELENKYAVIGIIPHVMDRDFTEYEKDLLGELHKIKIDLSDAIFVVNVDGYIGESVKNEIEYAKQKGKEIIYLENTN
jgi:hypothetical protein